MIEFDEADDVAAATTAVAVEEILLRVHQQAGFVIWVQRTQPQEAAEADGPGLLPTMCLEILQKWNLLFEFIESGSIHGLLASIGRIRQKAMKSQATMVGDRKKCTASHLSQHHRVNNRRWAHRRRVEGSGERDGSLQCGADRSTEAPAAMLSHACFRQCKLKGAEGASQSGRIVKVFPQGRQIPRRTHMRSCWSSSAWRSRCP
jgi:hypothetical protein